MAYDYTNAIGAANQQGNSEAKSPYEGYLQQSKTVDRRPSFREFIEPEIRYHRRLSDELERLLKNFQPVISID